MARPPFPPLHTLTRHVRPRAPPYLPRTASQALHGVDPAATSRTNGTMALVTARDVDLGMATARTDATVLATARDVTVDVASPRTRSRPNSAQPPPVSRLSSPSPLQVGGRLGLCPRCVQNVLTDSVAASLRHIACLRYPSTCQSCDGPSVQVPRHR